MENLMVQNYNKWAFVILILSLWLPLICRPKRNKISKITNASHIKNKETDSPLNNSRFKVFYIFIKKHPKIVGTSLLCASVVCVGSYIVLKSLLGVAKVAAVAGVALLIGGAFLKKGKNYKNDGDYESYQNKSLTVEAAKNNLIKTQRPLR